MTTEKERNLISLAIEAGLDIEAFKEAMLADRQWHGGDDKTDWINAPYPGAVLAALAAYEAKRMPIIEPTWRTMDSAPVDGTKFIAITKWRCGKITQGTYHWDIMRECWHNPQNGTVIKESFQDKFLWSAMPDEIPIYDDL